MNMDSETLPHSIGAHLARLRAEARVSQAEIASKIGVDQSRISRFEKGEAVPSAIEAKRFLTELGTASALRYVKFIEREWNHLMQPAFDNPHTESLWATESRLSALDKFCSERELPAPLLAQIEMHKNSAVRAAEYLNSMAHDIAFIGDIGVGKSTALCFISNLLLPSSGSGLDKVVLEVGSGGITICEVHVRRGPAYGIVVEPHSDSEIYREVEELCAGLWSADDSEISEELRKGVSRETDRALRNMAGLPRRKEKTADNKRISIDPARDLASTCTSLSEFQSSFAERLKLWERTRREVWYEADSKQSPQEWLRKTFTEINNGRRKDISLPKRIDVLVPDAVFDKTPYSINIVDTKGVDQTAIRPDLENRLRDSRTLTVLCSRFNDAPGATMQHFLEHAQKSLPEGSIRDQVALLVLPRADEARAMKDDTGEVVESDDEGYELKCDQALGTLQRVGLGALPIFFFNASSDDPEVVKAKLVELLDGMRTSHADRLGIVCAAIDRLMENYEVEAAAAVEAEVRKRLGIFLDQYKKLPDRVRQAQHELIQAFRTLNARTVWATTRRRGGWYNLDIFFYLGRGSAIDANLRSRAAFNGLAVLIENMLADTALASAHELLTELKEAIVDWKKDFIDATRSAGEEIFRPVLSDDTDLWSRCEQRWGQGSGYRDDVAETIQNWFEADGNIHLHKSLETKVGTAWKTEVVEPLGKLLD